MKTLYITDFDFSANDKNFSYLLGFQASFGAMIIGENNLKIWLDSRYFDKTKLIDKERIRRRLGEKNLIIEYIKIEKDFIKLLINEIKEEKEINLNNNISIKYSEQISKNYNGKINFIDNPLSVKRLYKDKEEIKNIKKAILVIDKVFIFLNKLNEKGKLIGKTEKSIRKIIVKKIFEYNGDGESFQTIVAFGVNSAVPHHQTGDTIVGKGVLLIDMGAIYNSYCSDFTRTFWVGEKNGEEYDEFIKIKDIVKKAHELAFKNCRNGMTGSELDKIARDYIKKNGYGDYFTHSLGHGIGLDVHEKPWISIKQENFLENKMFFTIEPGIYLKEKFGVRLEDIVYMEKNKLKKFSKIEI